jgi:hypothetical protein
MLFDKLPTYDVKVAAGLVTLHGLQHFCCTHAYRLTRGTRRDLLLGRTRPLVDGLHAPWPRLSPVSTGILGCDFPASSGARKPSSLHSGILSDQTSLRNEFRSSFFLPNAAYLHDNRVFGTPESNDSDSLAQLAALPEPTEGGEQPGAEGSAFFGFSRP